MRAPPPSMLAVVEVAQLQKLDSARKTPRRKSSGVSASLTNLKGVLYQAKHMLDKLEKEQQQQQTAAAASVTAGSLQQAARVPALQAAAAAPSAVAQPVVAPGSKPQPPVVRAILQQLDEL